MLTAQAAGNTLNAASTVFAILASAIIVLGGIAALVRVIWRVSNMLRDATSAIQRLTDRLDALDTATDGKFDQLSQRVHDLEVKTK